MLTLASIQGRISLEDAFSPVLGLIEDRVAATTRAIDRGFASAQKSFDRFGDGASKAARGLLPLSAGLATLGVGAVKAATETNSALANVSALLTDLSGPQLDKAVGDMKTTVRELAVDMGKSTTDLTGGLYEVISALGYTEDTFGQLETSAKAGAAGLATTQEAFNFLSGVTKTYGDTSEAAFRKAANLGFQAVNFGQTTFPQLASSIGGIAPLAKVAGVSMEEMFAVIATATGVTGNTAEVTTQMASALNALLDPSKDMAGLFETLGVKTGQALIAERGFVGALQAVAEYSKATETPMTALLGRKEAFIITASLAGAQADTFAQRMKNMGDAGRSSATVLEDAFDKQTKGINAAGFAWKQFTAEVRVELEEFGDIVLPILMRAWEELEPWRDRLRGAAEWFGALPQGIQTTAVALAGLGVAAAPFLFALGSMADGIAAILRLGGNIPKVFGGVGQVLFDIGNSVPVLTARLWLMENGWTAVMAAARGAVAFLGGISAPVTAIVLGVTAATAILWKFVGGWEGVKDILIGVGTELKATWQLVMDLGTIAKWAAEETLATFVKWLGEAWDELKVFGQALEYGARLGLRAFADAFPEVFQQLERLEAIARRVAGNVSDAFGSFMQGQLQKLYENVKPLLDVLDRIDRWRNQPITWPGDKAKAIREGELPLLPAAPQGWGERATTPKPFGPTMSGLPLDVEEAVRFMEAASAKLLAPSPSSMARKSLSSELAQTQRAVEALTDAERANILAGDTMGLTAEAIADRMRKPQAVVQMFLDGMRDARKVTNDFASGLRDLAADVALGFNTLSDTEFADEFESKLRDAERELKKRSLTHPTLELGIERLNDIDTRKWVDKLRLDIENAKGEFAEIWDAPRQAEFDASFKGSVKRFADEWNEAERKKQEAFERSTAGARKHYADLRNDSTATVDQIQRAWDTWFERDWTDRVGWADSWSRSLRSLGEGFQRIAQIAGDSMAEVARDIGTFIAAMDLGLQSVKGFARGRELLRDAKTAEDRTAAASQIAANAMGLYGSLDAATSRGSTGARIGKGAAYGGVQGAMMGMALGAKWGSAAGWLGIGAGAVAGATYGFIKSRMVPKEEKEARKFYQEWADETVAQFLRTADAGKLAEAQGERWRMVNIGVRDSILAIGGTEAQAMKLLENLNNATHHSAEAVQAALAPIQAAMQEQIEDQDILNAAVEKYGFTLDQLGPKYRQTKMNDRALLLGREYWALVNAGFDDKLVNQKMGLVFSEFLDDARRTGAEVPIALQPIFESLVASGDLIDATGVAVKNLEDLGDINWMRTMGQEFDRLVEKLESLFERFFGLKDAIDDIPREVIITVTPRIASEDADYTGDKAVPRARVRDEDGLPSQEWLDNLPGFEGGTDGYVDFGKGTPVMLHGEESVTPKGDEEDDYAGGGTVVYHVENHIAIHTMSAAGMREMIQEELAPAVVREIYRGNPGGARSIITKNTRPKTSNY